MIRPPKEHVRDRAKVRARCLAECSRLAFVDVDGAPVWHDGETIHGADYTGILPVVAWVGADGEPAAFASLLDDGRLSAVARWRVKRWRFDGCSWREPLAW